MVSNSQLRQDLLVTLLILAIIGGITGAILYKQHADNPGPENPNPPNPPVDNNDNNTNTDTNNTNTDPVDTNTTNPDNGNNTDVNNNTTDPQDYFEYVCSIKPTAEICLKPIGGFNSSETNSSTTTN